VNIVKKETIDMRGDQMLKFASREELLAGLRQKRDLAGAEGVSIQARHA
jgi:hypothetical protein